MSEHKKRVLYCFIAILIAFLAFALAQTLQDTKLNTPTNPCLQTQYLSNPNGTNTTCNSIPFNSATTFYLHNTSSGFSYNSKDMNASLNLSTGLSYTNITSVATGNVLLQNWTSPALNVLSIPSGVHLVHVHAIKSGGNVNRVIKLFYECGSVNATGGNLSIRMTSELSEELVGGTITEIDMDMLMAAQQFNLTDRMIIRVWANSTGGGANPDIQLLFDDATDSRLALPTAAVDTSGFVTYTGATADVILGTHNISANSITTTGTNKGNYPNDSILGLQNNNTLQDVKTLSLQNNDTTTIVDIGSTSTIIGWGSYTHQSIFYEVYGNVVYVVFNLRGTSNSAITSFTVPITASTTDEFYSGSLIVTEDNGVLLATPGRAYIQSGTAKVVIDKDMAGAAWTSTGSKFVTGSIWYWK